MSVKFAVAGFGGSGWCRDDGAGCIGSDAERFAPTTATQSSGVENVAGCAVPIVAGGNSRARSRSTLCG